MSQDSQPNLGVFGSTLHIKKDSIFSIFLGPKLCNCFFKVKDNSSPLSVSKNIYDFVGGQGHFFGTPLDTTLLWLDNTFNCGSHTQATFTF
jgi:hypothetical protein